jgi:hypothetical protein
MNPISKYLFVGLIALSAPIAGCVVSTEPASVVVVAPGTATFTWSLASRFDPSACALSRADTILIRVYDINARFVDDYTAPCETHTATIELDSGNYSGTATLLDSAGNPRTTDINLVPFTVYSNTDTPIELDFPPESFF